MNQILVSSYAKLPAHITSEEVYKSLVLALVIDTDTDVIQKAEVSLVTELTRDFLAGLLVGYHMDRGPEPLLEAFERCYFGSAKKAVETAVRAVFPRYEEIKAAMEA